MTEIVSFLDNGTACWARIRMADGSPCWVGIAQTGILVKRSKIGLFGKVVFKEADLLRAAQLMQLLDDRFTDDLTPSGITSPTLRPIVNAILNCQHLAEVSAVLTSDDAPAQEHELGADRNAVPQQPATAVNLIHWNDYLPRLAERHKPTTDVEAYADLPFDCACGYVHTFGQSWLMAELPGEGFVMKCPSPGGFQTVVRLEMTEEPAFVSDFGCCVIDGA